MAKQSRTPLTADERDGIISGRQFSQVFAGQNVGVTQVGERMWLVTFMHYDLGYFDDETCRLEPIENPFGPKVLPMSPE
jgi:putative transposase